MKVLDKANEKNDDKERKCLDNDIRLNKMEDDLKNLINEKDEIIKNMYEKLITQEKIIKNQSEKI